MNENRLPALIAGEPGYVEMPWRIEILPSRAFLLQELNQVLSRWRQIEIKQDLWCNDTREFFRSVAGAVDAAAKGMEGNHDPRYAR